MKEITCAPSSGNEKEKALRHVMALMHGEDNVKNKFPMAYKAFSGKNEYHPLTTGNDCDACRMQVLHVAYIAGDYEKILRAEEDKVSAFMAESMPEGCGMESFLLRQDYHNAKALTKAKYMRIEDADFMLAPEGTVDVGLMKECVYSDSYSRLPDIMAKALSEIARLAKERRKEIQDTRAESSEE